MAKPPASSSFEVLRHGVGLAQASAETMSQPDGTSLSVQFLTEQALFDVTIFPKAFSEIASTSGRSNGSWLERKIGGVFTRSQEPVPLMNCVLTDKAVSCSFLTYRNAKNGRYGTIIRTGVKAADDMVSSSAGFRPARRGSHAKTWAANEFRRYAQAFLQVSGADELSLTDQRLSRQEAASLAANANDSFKKIFDIHHSLPKRLQQGIQYSLPDGYRVRFSADYPSSSDYEAAFNQKKIPLLTMMLFHGTPTGPTVRIDYCTNPELPSVDAVLYLSPKLKSENARDTTELLCSEDKRLLTALLDDIASAVGQADISGYDPPPPQQTASSDSLARSTITIPLEYRIWLDRNLLPQQQFP